MDASNDPDHPKPSHHPALTLAAVVVVGFILAALLASWAWTRQASAPSKTSTGTTAIPATSPRIRLALFATGLSNPTSIVSTGQATDSRLFVLDRDGIIRILGSDGTVATTPFLDIKDQVLSKDEMGLLGLVFSPHYAQDGYFFINYIDKNQNTIIARYHVSSNPNQADKTTAQTVLTLKQPYPNHNGGALLFGKDGYLYASLGDGGSGGDPENRAQNVNSLFGKILRLDVSSLPYKIPASNPFIHQTNTRPEIWDYGLRNPWRITFDRQTHDLYIADVGQGSIEEVDVEAASSKGGINYGWRCYEGNNDFNLAGCQSKDHYTFPILQYTHDNGRCAVTGGYVYRGQKYPALTGKYFYGDLCTGELFWAQKQNGKWQSTRAVDSPYSFTTFGEDNHGELYVADFGTGSIYQLIDTN